MLKKVLLAALVLLLLCGVALWRAPARIAANLAADNSGGSIRLLAPTGTIWQGSGALLINTAPIGTLNWQLKPLALAGLQAAVDWQLDGSEFNLSGTLESNGTLHHLTQVNGRFSERLLQEHLGRYDIAPGGELYVEQLDITDLELNQAQTWPTRVTAQGSLSWSGGPVSYVLAGRRSDIDLPPLDATIFTGKDSPTPGWPEMLVTQAGNDAPLITARLTPAGSAAVGITKGFTRLAGQPWPGSEPDHAIVLEVEEQLN